MPLDLELKDERKAPPQCGAQGGGENVRRAAVMAGSCWLPSWRRASTAGDPRLGVDGLWGCSGRLNNRIAPPKRPTS